MLKQLRLGGETQGHFFSIEGGRVVVTLHVLATGTAEFLFLLDAVDPLGDDFEPNGLRNVNCAVNNGCISGVVHHMAHKCLINFDR